MTTDFWYATDREGRWRYAIQCATDDLHLAAEQAAEDFHSNHDGWEATWPVTFTVFATQDGPPIAQVTVDREVVPSFFVTECTEHRDSGFDR